MPGSNAVLGRPTPAHGGSSSVRARAGHALQASRHNAQAAANDSAGWCTPHGAGVAWQSSRAAHVLDTACSEWRRRSNASGGRIDRRLSHARERTLRLLSEERMAEFVSKGYVLVEPKGDELRQVSARTSTIVSRI